MSEPKLISPMLDNFAIGGPISEHHGVSCCPAMENAFNDKYIVKIISVPASQTQLDALLLTGAYSSLDSALAYFKEIADGIKEEYNVLEKLSQLEGFLPYRDCQCEPKEDGTGFDVYLLSPYRRSLTRQFVRNPLTQLDVLNLGLDMCAALAVCRRSGYMYVDLKPNNIYVTEDKGYFIGDLGFIPLSSLKYASLPERYISEYTAPEITDAFSSLNTTMDIYALGLIMYQAYNNGDLPSAGDDGCFSAPEYADYEMAEIIMKALAKQPQDRWQDPTQMGQALVEYMQRNGANDIPIVPVAPPVQDTAPASSEEEASESDAPGIGSIPDGPHSPEDAQISQVPPDEDISADLVPGESQPSETEDPIQDRTGDEAEGIMEGDEFINLSFLDDDDTAEENGDISYGEISDEVSDILSQADELVSHPVPDPVVAPDPIDVPLPEPIVLEEEEVESGDAPEEAAQNEDAEAPTEETEEASGDVEEDSAEYALPEKKRSHWLRNIIIVLVIAGLLAGGYYYFENYYTQSVDAVTAVGTEDKLTVTVDSGAADELLYVVCSDPHGNKLTEKVVDGKAEFEQLLPNTTYSVTVAIEGFHRLTGNTTTTYSTPQQTNIVQFNAVTGPEDGSVILGFTVEGPDSDNWCVTYSAEGEEPELASFPGHSVSLNGLTVGKEYTFTLAPETWLYVNGALELTHTAQKLVYAEDLKILSCVDSTLTASWSAPAGTQVESWTVRCNGEGYSQSIVTTEPFATFEEIDHTASYTVEVVAAGMSVSQRVQVDENSVTISNFQVEQTAADQLTLTWDASADISDDGWILKSYVNGAEVNAPVICTDNSAVIKDIVPGAQYTFLLEDLNDTDFLGVPVTYQSADVQAFACDYDGYEITADDITFSMVRTPERSNWNRYHLYDEDYTTSFASGEKASFLMHMEKRYGNSSDKITSKFIIHDAEGALVSLDTRTAVWNDMWLYYYGELDIPQMPTAAGDYTISVYFDGALVNTQEFTITE